MATEAGGKTEQHRESWVKEEALVSLEGSCPLGLLPTLGPWALVPARELSGTLALLPEPPQAISRHKILRTAKSHNMSTERPQVTLCPTPQMPTRGFLEKGPALCGPPLLVANTTPGLGSSLASPSAGLGDIFQPQPRQGGARGRSAVGAMRPPPGLPSWGSFLHLGWVHRGLNRSCRDGAG